MIEEVRKHLNELINEKGNLLDSEVIVASQMLDCILNQYYQVLSKKKMDKQKKEGEVMEVGQVVKEQQPEVHKRLKNKPRKKCRIEKESLSFSDFQNMMKYDSYTRHRGAIR